MTDRKRNVLIQPRSDLTLKHERPYYPTLPKDGNLFEGLPQQLVIARTDEEDVIFWVSAYFFNGVAPGGFLATDAATLGLNLIILPHKDRGKMTDTDFVAYGFSPLDFVNSEDVKISSTPDQVVWHIKDTEFVCRPPYWEVKGKQSGVEYDLKITGTAPTNFYLGDYDNIIETGVANFNQFTAITGTISTKGKTYQIEQGYGCHEHPIVARQMGSMVDRYRHSSHYWIVGGGEGVQSLVYGDFPGRDSGSAKLLLDGKYMGFNTDVNVEVTETWHDPRTLATIPCKWHVTMSSEEGSYDVQADASGRANRIWCLRDGYVLDVWFVGAMNGVFTHPDGTTRPIKDVPFVLEWLRTIWP